MSLGQKPLSWFCQALFSFPCWPSQWGVLTALWGGAEPEHSWLAVLCAQGPSLAPTHGTHVLGGLPGLWPTACACGEGHPELPAGLGRVSVQPHCHAEASS